MTHALLDPELTWWQLLLISIGLVLVGELGFRLGRRHRSEHIDEKKSQASVYVAALLGLLGLMLAFSFGIVANRFDARKALVLQEANAIGTTYLRAKMLPAPQGQQIESLLKRYVSDRSQQPSVKALQRALEQSGELQQALWTEATEVATANPQSLVVSNFVVALNEMFDLQESRVTVALHQRLPPTILAMLYAIAMLSIGVLGFAAGLGRARSIVPTAALVLAITAVVALIVDLDNPGSRMFAVNQSALSDLQEMMARDYHRPPAMTSSAR